MKIGIFSDVHANFDALAVVLAAGSHLDALLCLGDLVGYYDRPQECCDLIRSRGIPTVIGNHEQFVTGEQNYSKERADLYRVDWTRAKLNRDSLLWLRSLPVEMRIVHDGWTFVARHASPWDVSTYLYADAPQLARVQPRPRECWLFGHTHHPFALERNDGWIVNVGSVGQPRSGPAGADLAVFDTETGRPELIRCAYNSAALQKRLEDSGWAESLVHKLAVPSGQGTGS